MKDTVICPIILASDDNYAPFMYITMYSMLENKKQNTFYDFYLLVPSAFSSDNENKILELKNTYECDIHFVDMKDAFADLEMQISHITSPTYYRLLATEILPIEYSKCIYVDVDVVVCDDLQQLLSIDLADNYIAGVLAAGYVKNETYNCQRLNLPHMKNYVNAGVLLMNLQKIRNDNLVKKFLDLSKQNFSSQDQDVINVACFGKIKNIDLKFNAIPKRLFEKNKILSLFFTSEEIIIAQKHPVIIHYADRKKPWNSVNAKLGKIWWKYAKKTPYRCFLRKKRNYSLFSAIKSFLFYEHSKNEITFKIFGVKFLSLIKKDNKKVIKIAGIKIVSKKHYRKLKISDYPSALCDWYKNVTGYNLNLDNPQTFNEKIQWLKLYDSTPLKTRLADKYLVRDWVKEKIGEQYLIPLLGVYDKFEDIDFAKLPNQFVIKCNHGSGYNIIVTDKEKLNLYDTKQKINKWMKENYAFKCGFELQYRDIKPKIIIEQFLSDNECDELRDYKITCFNGVPEFIWIDECRYSDHKRNLYDLNWNQLNYKINSKYTTFPSPPKPFCLDKIISLAKILSEGFSYVRVDFYLVNNKIYFGEMTFTSSSGTEDVLPQSFDKYLASKLVLPI
ncbi:MAG: hypothetical protein E7017_03075 [Alphaproteobacteria bacterium]|nr:hypothetical protein [Alphaproteobacteria bacterium]